jgi:cytochrome P450
MAQRKELILTDLNAKNSSEDLETPQRNILMDHIILNEEKFTPEEIRDHILTFVSGYETWASGLAHTMMLLAMHPEKQEKLYREVQAEFLTDEDLQSSEKINSFKYLDFVIKEALRLMPTLPMVMRQTLEDFEIEPGLVIPKGTCLLINFFVIFRRKDIWGEDAGEFKPERFSDDNLTTRQQLAYFPFSSGPRICIAYKYSIASLKIAIIKLVRDLKFSTTMKMTDIRLKSYVSLKLCSPHLMTVHKR